MSFATQVALAFMQLSHDLFHNLIYAMPRGQVAQHFEDILRVLGILEHLSFGKKNGKNVAGQAPRFMLDARGPTVQVNSLPPPLPPLANTAGALISKAADYSDTLPGLGQEEPLLRCIYDSCR